MVVVPLHHSYPWEVGLPSLAIDITRGCRNFSQLRIESIAVKLLTVLPSQSVLPSHTATSTVLAIDMLELEDMTHLPGVCVPFIPTLCSRCNRGVLCVREERTCVCWCLVLMLLLIHFSSTHSHIHLQCTTHSGCNDDENFPEDFLTDIYDRLSKVTIPPSSMCCMVG